MEFKKGDHVLAAAKSGQSVESGVVDAVLRRERGLWIRVKVNEKRTFTTRPGLVQKVLV